MTDTPTPEPSGPLAGLWQDIVRELGPGSLKQLGQFGADRTLWKAAFLGGCALVLVGVPIYLAAYAAGVKRFNSALATELQGTVALKTNAFGFPLYPIEVSGTWEGLPVQVRTVQRYLNKPLFPVDRQKEWRSRVSTHLHLGLARPTPISCTIRRPGWRLTGPPEGWTTVAPATTVGDWTIQSNDAAAMTTALDPATCKALRGLDEGLAGLTIGLGPGGFEITCAGPLRDLGAVAAIKQVIAFCHHIGKRLQAAAAP